ncbi:MAG: 2Fe-2S iron-sulfur cluster-binding protein [Pseudomonadota bacterium]
METDTVTVWIDGGALLVARGASVLAALVQADNWCTRLSVGGAPRFALCGIGQCQECRVSVDGAAHQLACQLRCRDGMRIASGGAA